MNKQKRSAFTLVELIVVITILAILGTIAFISLQGYSTQARDSTRISDLSSMRTSLELFQLDAGKYPLPTDSFSVTYSGSEVWIQGTFGDSTFKNVESLDKIPTDPLDDRKYAYSVTNTRQEYQLSGVMEGDDLVFVGVNAGDKEATAVVTGNYNGNVLKTLSGTTCEILSVPSIISSQDETTTELTTILGAEGLVYNGKNNLPSNFRVSKYNAEGGFAFTSNKLVAYSDTGSCAPLYDGDDSTARTTLITNLQTAYSGTILKNAGGIKNIVNVDLNDSNAVNLFASSLVNNSLGGDVIFSTVNGGLEEVVLNPYDSCTGVNTPIPFPALSIYGDGTINECNTPDITVCSGEGNGYILSACNVGTITAASSHNDTNGYGELFQWGNNAGIKNALTNGVQTGSTLGFSPSTYSHNVFIRLTDDWTSHKNDDLWGAISGSDLDRKGPCEEGYHVPASSEWAGIHSVFGGTLDGLLLSSYLKLPFPGYRHRNVASIYDSGVRGNYLASSVNLTKGGVVVILSGTASFNGSGYRSTGSSVRCLKN